MAENTTTETPTCPPSAVREVTTTWTDSTGHRGEPLAEYIGVSGVAAWFGVAPGTVTKWLTRYDGWPQPDAYVTPGRHGDRDKLWLPAREADWRAWKGTLPGQGAPGRPKPRRTRGAGVER